MKTRFLFLAAAALFLSLETSLCQVRPDHAQLSAWKDFENTNPGNWRIRWDGRTGTPASIYFGKTKPYSGDPEQAARTFLEENSALTKMKSDLSNLKLSRIIAHHNISDVTFQETYSGIPVEGAEYQVHVLSDGCVDMTNGKYYPSVTAPTTVQVDSEASLTIAKNDIGKDAVVSGSPSKILVVLPDSGRFLLAWEVSIATKNPYGDWIYFVDASNNKIILKQSHVRDYVTGKGNIYPRSPNQAEAYGVTLYNLDGSGHLSGKYSNDINQISNRGYSPTEDFEYNPAYSVGPFDETNVYQHVDQYCTYYLESSNIGFDPYDQSHYIGQVTAYVDEGGGMVEDAEAVPPNTLHFGAGLPPDTRDFARDDKVIYHEYTHLVTYSVIGTDLGGYYDEAGAINEGNSDYFAGSYTRRSVIGDYADPSVERDMSNPKIATYAAYLG